MLWLVLFVLVVGLAIGVAGTLRLVQWTPRGAPPANADDSQIVDGAEVTVTGTVRILGEPLISPLSARSCVLYETFASLYEEPGAEPEAPRALVAQLAERKMIAFELLTSLGVIVIEGDAGDAVDLELSPTPVFPRRPEREARFLREHERDERLIETTTFEELTIDPDALISVRGRAVVESPTKLRIVGSADQPLVIGAPRPRAVS